MRVTILLATCLGLAHALVATAAAQKHPHYDDKGTLQWHTSFAPAKETARKREKLILVEIGANT
jgi:hypothetical protein